MYSVVQTAAIHGIDSVPIRVEADVSNGMPQFNMVGYLGSEVKEARERVTTALRNSGFPLPIKHITVNLYPADLRKSGTGFDLPVALAILAALGIVPAESLETTLVIGEVNLQGRVQPIPGVLPIVAEAAKQGISRCMIPCGNRSEAALVEGMRFLPVQSIADAVAFLTGEKVPEDEPPVAACESRTASPDFADIRGQRMLKRACEVACAGMHNLLMIGPPGAGKSMAAARLPSILPPMDFEERMELCKIRSVAGLYAEEEYLTKTRPFRAPHHTISPQGMAGGGAVPHPGEISLAHNGILFLDELTEFSPAALELLRQPMEEHVVRLVRVSGSFQYPAKFMLAAAMNPCQCGYFPDRNRCRCTPRQLERFLGKLSEPILDRIDLCVQTARVEYTDLTGGKQEERSETIRARVIEAQERQRRRFKDEPFRFNSDLTAGAISRFVPLGDKEARYMEEMFSRLSLSARGYHKVLKVARTIADLAGHERVGLPELTEAICYRGLDKRFWDTERDLVREEMAS